MTARLKVFTAAVLFLGMVSACGGENKGEPLGDRLIMVPLSYDDESNFGPKSASGTAEIETSTGNVSIAVQGLDRLDTDDYEGWLTGGGETPVSTGKFNTDVTGIGSSMSSLGDVSGKSYTRVMITVETRPDPDPKKPNELQKSIGGDIPEP